MDKNTLFAFKSQPVPLVLSNGETLYVRKLRQSEVEHITKSYRGEDKSVEGNRYIANRCTVDANGERVFSDSDLSKMGDLDFELINEISLKVAEISGLTGPKK